MEHRGRHRPTAPLVMPDKLSPAGPRPSTSWAADMLERAKEIVECRLRVALRKGWPYTITECKEWLDDLEHQDGARDDEDG